MWTYLGGKTPLHNSPVILCVEHMSDCLLSSLPGICRWLSKPLKLTFQDGRRNPKYEEENALINREEENALLNREEENALSQQTVKLLTFTLLS